MTGEKPIVSVVMITYMHEQFIADAINGVLIQEVDFPVELIVADDCSPDGTEKIVKSFESHPNFLRIKYSKHSKNIGMMPNFIWAMEQANGKFIALCEGDDYWTDPLKLQKQVDFLEKNNGYALSFHRTVELNPGGEIKASAHTINSNQSKDFDFFDLTKSNFIHTCSAVFRRELIELPEWIKNMAYGDYPLWLLLANKGKVNYCSDSMAVYRKGVGVMSQSYSNTASEKWLELLYILKNHFMINDFNNQINGTLDIIAKSRLVNSFSSPKFLAKNIRFSTLLLSLLFKMKALFFRKFY